MARIPTIPTKTPLGLQRWSQNPMVVSAIASLGAHILFFAILPILPNSVLKPGEPDIKEPVGIVELTPEERGRLPDISTAPPELPPIAREPLPDQTPAFGQTTPFNLSPLPNQAAPPNFPSYLTPPPALPPFIFTQPEAPQRVTIPTEPESSALPQPSASPKPSSSPSASPQPSVSPSASPSSLPSDRPTPTPGQTTDNLPFEPTPLPSSTASPAPSPRSPEEIRQAQIQAETARIRQRSEQIAAQTAAQTAAQAPDDTAVGQSAVIGNFSTWSAAVNNWLNGNEQKIRQGSWRKPSEVVGTYPKDACPLQPKQPVMIGVLVDEKGAVSTEEGKRPQLVQGSGFAIFNRQAIEEATAASFKPTGGKEAYLIQFNYAATGDTCAASPPGSPAPQGEAPK